jgi:two-component system, chemotaxis family, sensor kinase CheA
MASDPYKYFRIEARELLEAMTQGVLELEKGGAGKDLIGRLLRYAHTLKGAARIVEQLRISELSHGIEDALAGYRNEGAGVSHEQINKVLKELDEISTCLRSIESPAPEESKRAPSPTLSSSLSDESFEFVRVDIREMDALLREVSEAAVHVSQLGQQAGRIEEALRLAEALEAQLETASTATGASGNGTIKAKALPLAEQIQASIHTLRRDFTSATEKANREVGSVQGRVGDLRLLPASIVFASLERTARDAADSLKKQVHFETAGGDNRLDAHVLRAVRDALAHVVRNAVAHGIETPAQRSAAGKSPTGEVQLRVERRGSRMAFVCCDDGGGIDVAQIRRSAVQRGLVTPAEAPALGLEDAIRLIFRPGVTATGRVTELAGRGIGLDVVRETATRLKGEARVESTPGQGTRIEIIVPVSLESLAVLEVDADGQTFGVPLEAVEQAKRVHSEEIAQSGEGASILWAGKAIPFVPLSVLLRLQSQSPRGVLPRARGDWSVLLLRTEAGVAAIGVDRVLGRARVVMRPLPNVLGEVGLIAGASFDSEGNPQPVVDAGGAILAAVQVRWVDAEPVVAAKRPLLIVDDSLTTRMLEQSLLETAGYEVDLAISGEEALAKARQRQYAMFIVDIEMPGMDGFEFIERARNSPDLRAIPCILVTSRNSAEDRLRGENLGARAYIVKSEFSEGRFLRTIKTLVG